MAPESSQPTNTTKPPKPVNAHRLDLAELAQARSILRGEQPLASFIRLQQPGEPEAEAATVLHWQAQAEYRPVRGGQPELWLHLTLNTTVLRTCQRCLQPVSLPLALGRDFLFAPTEAQAQAWDAEREDADALVLSKSFNLLELAEDELLLALPLVPRHEACPEPLGAPAAGRARRGVYGRAAGEATRSGPDGPGVPGGRSDAGGTGQSSSEEPERDNPFAILAQLKRRH
jgi:uncharacterized protein